MKESSSNDWNSSSLKSYRRSVSIISLANSTLTTSSQENQTQINDSEANWCAQKIRKQRIKMEKLLFCYEQQRKCINELEEYIDQLQKNNCIKDEEIFKLRLSKSEQIQVHQFSNSIQKQIAKDQQEQRNKMFSLINGQLKFYDLQHLRWQKQIQSKEGELAEQKEAYQQEITSIKQYYQQKIIQSQQRNISLQAHLSEKNDKLLKENQSLRQKITEIEKKIEKNNEFEQMLKLRRQLSAKQNQVNFHQLQMTNQIQVLKEEIETLKSQIKKLKKDNCKLKNQLQTKQFDFNLDQKITANVETYRDKSLKIQIEDKIRLNQKLLEQLNKYKKELYQVKLKYQKSQNQNHSLQSQIDILRAQFTSRTQKAKRLEYLRDQQHQQIENLNKIFKKIDFF